MRARLPVLAVSVLILAIQWSGEPGRALAPAPKPRQTRPVPARVSPAVTEPTPWPASARDPFRFEGPELRATERPGAEVVAGSVAAPSPPPVRLVGLVRRPSGLQAALAADGEVVLVSVGDRLGGFTVTSLEEEGTVRLRGPDGAELVLTLPEEP